MAFKMNGWSAFTKIEAKSTSPTYKMETINKIDDKPKKHDAKDPVEIQKMSAEYNALEKKGENRTEAENTRMKKLKAKLDEFYQDDNPS